MGRHSAPVEENVFHQGINDGVLPLGHTALYGSPGEGRLYDNEQDKTGIVNMYGNLLDSSAIQATRSHYQKLAEGLPEDFQDYTSADSLIARRANHMTAYPSTHVIDIRERRTADFADALEHFAPRLQEQHFINREALLGDVEDTSQALVIETEGGSPLTLPVRNFVSAEGFQSWGEARGTNTPKLNEHGERVNSAALLKDYASRVTQAPPIQKVIGFVQPNGLILYTTREGSHRTGAAVMRGDETIQAKTLSLLMLSRNVIGLEEADVDSRPAA